MPTSRSEVLLEVSRVVAATLMVPDITLTEETTAADVEGWDSLTHVQIIIAIEQEYGFQFSFADVSQLENAGDLVSAILAKSPRFAKDK